MDQILTTDELDVLEKYLSELNKPAADEAILQNNPDLLEAIIFPALEKLIRYKQNKIDPEFDEWPGFTSAWMTAYGHQNAKELKKTIKEYRVEKVAWEKQQLYNKELMKMTGRDLLQLVKNILEDLHINKNQ
ncbi:hypothetical protein LX87_02497 [Larkinella arboricola]|uniref:Uncharacterized protein n=1 Tax=Larkinella arboricola TaxID=643671 RepID=A0A327WZK3_LARAB|nr:hypothetical protein [Larkinella arboricola]RAJ97594.1 hypothetical protein LX87_02497 [Larkinella arboricola]